MGRTGPGIAPDSNPGRDAVADTFVDQIAAALSLAAADPGGVALYKSKADPGLFPATAAGRPAAQKALADGLLQLVPATGLRPGKELAAVTPKGLDYLAGVVSPKQVLDDFVRAIERREVDVRALTTEVTRLSGELRGLKTAVQAVLPRVVSARVPADLARQPAPASAGVLPCPAHRLPPSPESESAAMPAVRTPGDVAHLSPPSSGGVLHAQLAGPVLARLTDWAASAAAGQDCPLPELFRSLSTLETPPTIGTFHDCLRDLAAARRVFLHPWTGPLYALPEPEYALLVGHNVAYYASPGR